jgi:hypothetical protein
VLKYGNNMDIAVLLPGESLLTQIADWAQRHSQFSLNVIHSAGRQAVLDAFQRAAKVVIDGSTQPALAMDVLDMSTTCVEANDILLYTERASAPLEIFVRVRGVALVLGPIVPSEWDAMLQSSITRHANCWEGNPVRLKIRSAS